MDRWHSARSCSILLWDGHCACWLWLWLRPPLHPSLRLRPRLRPEPGDGGRLGKGGGHGHCAWWVLLRLQHPPRSRLKHGGSLGKREGCRRRSPCGHRGLRGGTWWAPSHILLTRHASWHSCSKHTGSAERNRRQACSCSVPAQHSRTGVARSAFLTRAQLWRSCSGARMSIILLPIAAMHAMQVSSFRAGATRLPVASMHTM
jgi:hypothetical protein